MSDKLCITECKHEFEVSYLWNYMKNGNFKCPTCMSELYLNKNKFTTCIIENDYPIIIPYNKYKQQLLNENKKNQKAEYKYPSYSFLPPPGPIFLDHSGKPNPPLYSYNRKTKKRCVIYAGPN